MCPEKAIAVVTAGCFAQTRGAQGSDKGQELGTVPELWAILDSASSELQDSEEHWQCALFNLK